MNTIEIESLASVPTITLALALVATAPSAAARPLALSTRAQSGVHVGKPPLAAQRSWAPNQIQLDNKYRASAFADCDGKKVSVFWRYSAAGNFEATQAAKDQVMAVGFWPTAAEFVAQTRLVVAGKERDGRTRIEVWTIRKPLLLQSAPGVVPATIALDPQPVADIQVVYDEATTGRDMVRALIQRRGPGSGVLVQFQDSKTLYELNWKDEPYALVPLFTTATEPLLLNEYDTFVAGNHSVEGYVYALSICDDLGQTPWLILKDQNRDGTIDWHGHMTPQDYIAAGLQDRTQYTECGGL